MYHRTKWEEVFGPIPDGYEINHRCKNRECCNVEHLECLTRSEHKSRDNALRYKPRCEAIYKTHLENPALTQKQIAEMFNVTPACVWGVLKRAKTSV